MGPGSIGTKVGTMDGTKASLRVRSRTLVARDVVALELEAVTGARLPDWTPGAHIELELPGGLVRPYSLCGDRHDAGRYRIGVRREPAGRGGSAYVHDRLDVGSEVAASAPRNRFPLIPAVRYRFVAGGIGITPLLPMIYQAQCTGVPWDLLYRGRARAGMPFLDELATYGDRVTVSAGDEHARPDVAAWIGAAGPDALGEHVYVCGPAPLIDAARAATAGRPAGLFHSERFVARAQESSGGPDTFEVVLARRGRTVTVGPGVSVLDAVRAAGAEVMSSCGQGVCGTCETVVLEGRPHHRDSVLEDDEREESGLMYPCVSRSHGRRLVLNL
ncbi:PDR/VanB family oxidoreductase [Kineosporia succinea]|uniref:Ferredoxin-NADP reductase n=1 Tax=Kineosporia succinea TaxID=84632 RepID=A0ABT9PAF2_9ACTN|nr:PDR/VanB family oxidoreductase [Kineosporia succinea]MDP9829659.1 ferredoxin-NADP reductase [Kineosporia succinea]